MKYKLYDILNVSPDASIDDIKKSYKKLAFQWHPDKNKDTPDEAEKKFKDISNAYSILSDPGERRKYDQLGDDNYNNNNNAGGGTDINPMDIFEKFFGQGMGHPFSQHDFGGNHFRHHFNFNDFSEIHHTTQISKCKSIKHIFNMNLEDSYKGVNKNIKITLTKHCKKCVNKCDNCQGKGMINQVRSMGIFTQMFTGTCGNCLGSGYKIKGEPSCELCNGKGSYDKEQNACLTLPPGVEDGFKTIFPELGEQPMHDKQMAGDLLFEIKIADHNIFTRKNNDLYYKHELSFIDSVIGKNIYIPYFEEIIELNTLNSFGIISPNKQYMIENKGMPFVESNNKKGNMIIEFIITYPKIKNKNKLSELKQLLEEIIE